MKVLYKLLDKHDSQNTLSIIEKELPEITSSDILVQVKSCRTLDLHNEIVKELFLKCPRPIIPAAVEVAGVIARVGENVSMLHNGDRVVGLIPVTSEWSGCAEFCIMDEYEAVKIPDGIDYSVAVSCLTDGLQAYTALQYMGHVERGDVILVLDGTTSWGRIAIQLAVIWGAKVITTVSTPDEKYSLERLKSHPDLVLLDSGGVMVNRIIEETGGLGVDVVIDNGVQLFMKDESYTNNETKSKDTTKHDIISLLAVGGRWITSCPHFQLDPPDSNQLLLRSASISFLFPHTWILCPSKHGRLQHILQNFFEKVVGEDVNVIRPKPVSFPALNSHENDVTVDSGIILEM